MQQRVLAAARQLDYHPSAAARSLVHQRTGTIGLVIADTPRQMRTNSFLPSVIGGITSVAGAADLKLLVQPMQDRTRPDVSLKLALEAHADGIILSVGCLSFGMDLRKDLAGSHLEDAVLSEARQNYQRLIERYASSAPFVLWGQLPRSDAPCVDIDNASAARIAVEHLIALGHRRIACITPGPLDQLVSVERLRGYRMSLEAHDIPYEEALVRYGNFDEASGFEGMLSLLDIPERPSAVFAASDPVAFGALGAAHSAGLSLPGELAVVGIDDLPASKYVTPPLTTVHVPAYEIGITAAQMLIEMIRTGKRPTSRLLETHLVVRESSGAQNESLQTRSRHPPTWTEEVSQ
jgi:LacI family transcriptional regulator